MGGCWRGVPPRRAGGGGLGNVGGPVGGGPPGGIVGRVENLYSLPAHSVAELFPAMDEDQYAALAQSVAANGVLSSVIVWRAKVVDGRHRIRAARDCGLAAAAVPVADISGLERAAMVRRVVAANLERRHLSVSQLAMVAARLSANSTHGGRREPGGSGDDDVVRQSDAAAALGVSVASASRARRVLAAGAPELAAAVADGWLSVTEAARLIKRVAEEVAAGRVPGWSEPDIHREILRRRNDWPGSGGLGLGNDSSGVMSFLGHWLRDHQGAVPKPAAPGGLYGVVVMDPPWPMVTLPHMRGGEVGATYSSSSLETIRANPPPVGAPGWVWLWTTDRHLWAARELLGDWNLEYAGTMIWVKNGGVKRPDGWTGNAEYALLGITDPAPAEFVVVGRAGSPRYDDTRRFFAVYPPLSATAAELAAWETAGAFPKT